LRGSKRQAGRQGLEQRKGTKGGGGAGTVATPGSLGVAERSPLILADWCDAPSTTGAVAEYL
jgi:hypothetical protein